MLSSTWLHLILSKLDPPSLLSLRLTFFFPFFSFHSNQTHEVVHCLRDLPWKCHLFKIRFKKERGAIPSFLVASVADFDFPLDFSVLSLLSHHYNSHKPYWASELFLILLSSSSVRYVAFGPDINVTWLGHHTHLSCGPASLTVFLLFSCTSGSEKTKQRICFSPRLSIPERPS